MIRGQRFKHIARGAKRLPGVMNKAEQGYAAHLETRRLRGEIDWFKFEAVKLKLADKTFFSPDFLVLTGLGELQVHEVKAAWKDKKTNQHKMHIEDDANIKIKTAAELFPFRFYLCWLHPVFGWMVDEV